MDVLFNPWSWFIAALVLAGLEMLAPGAFMIWLAGAAAATGVVALFGPGWELQLVAFAVASVASVVLGRRWYRRHPPRTADPALNRRAQRLLGEVVTVIEPVDRNGGRVALGDGSWSARGPALSPGARARVMAVEGSCLLIEPLP